MFSTTNHYFGLVQTVKLTVVIPIFASLQSFM